MYKYCIALVSFRWQKSFLEYVRDSKGNIIGAEGYFMDIFVAMQKRLNFTSKLLIGDEDAWGIQDDKGEWVGNSIVGKLARQYADITTTGLEVLETRSRVIDFTYPVMEERQLLFAKISDTSELHLFIYLDIFTYELWTVIALGIVLFSSFIFVMGYTECFKLSGKDRVESFLVSISVSCRQLLQIPPPELQLRYGGSRMALLVFALLFYVIFCHYTCDLTSRMTWTPNKLDIRSYEDVARLGYTVAVRRETSLEEKLRNIKRGIDLKIEAFDDDSVNTKSEILNKAKTLLLGVSSYFIIIDGVYALDLEQQSTLLLSFGLQKNSEYTQIFSHHLQKMDESGLLHRLAQKWGIKSVSKPKVSGAIPLGYENVLFPFIGVVIGTIIALTILFCEMLVACIEVFNTQKDLDLIEPAK